MFDTRRLQRDYSELNEAVKDIIEVLEQHTFDLQKPLKLRNHGSGPVFDIRQLGNEQHEILHAIDDTGQVVRLGIGAASAGIVANEFVPDTNFSLDPDQIDEVFRNESYPASSTFGLGVAGDGVPFRETVTPRSGWGAAFAGLQKSNDTEHAPDSADKLTRNGNVTWWCREAWKWQVVRCTITAINADTLTCSVVANGKVTAETITVAKPCYLRQTDWDGVTYSGVTYTYSNSQTRSADDGGSGGPTTEVVYPSYDTDSPCPVIFAEWVGNNTGITDVGWIDMNLDARHWVTQ